MSGAQISKLEDLLQGAWSLDEQVGDAVCGAQAGASFLADGDVNVDTPQDVDRAEDLMARLEITLDLLDAYSELHVAAYASGSLGRVEGLIALLQRFVEANLGAAMDAEMAELMAKAKAYDERWLLVSKQLVEAGANVAADAVIGQAIAFGVPFTLGLMSGVGTVPSLVAGATIAWAGGEIWDGMKKEVGLGAVDPGHLMGVAEETTGWMDYIADSTDVDHVNDAVRKHAGEVGDRAVAVGLVLDLVKAGHAIKGVYEASATWEAYQRQFAHTQEVWNSVIQILSGMQFVLNGLRADMATLHGTASAASSTIAALESIYGPDPSK